MSSTATTCKYFAFISYSRKDSKVAAWLQKRLEWFRFPVKLVPEDRRPPNPNYVRPVYRDKTNLEVTDEHYWTNIRRALEESRFLIVLCSPNSARSEPVNMEVRHFLEVHGGDTSRVVPIIVGGNVVSTGEDAALCPALRELGDELINRNLPTMVPDTDIAEQDAWESGFVALSSYLLQLKRTAIGDHIQRESRKQARTLRLWLGAVALFAALAVFAGWMAIRQLAETQRQLEYSWLEEGRAWLERARTAKGEKDHLKALMLAGRAVGFVGYGRKENDTPEIEKAYPPLLGGPFKDQDAEKQRQEELKAVQKFVDSISPTCLPIWSSPIQAHHDDSVDSVAFSPDGSRVASGSADKTVKLWEVASGKELATLQGHSEQVTSVAFSPDGTRVASGSADKTVKLWEVASGKELATLQGHLNRVSSVAFSPDGTRVASGSYDKTVKLWDVASGKELATLQGHSEWVGSVAFSPDGSRVISGSADTTVKLWEVASGKELATLQGYLEWVISVAFSPDGKRLASGSDDNTVKLWDVASGKKLATLQGHSDSVTSVAFSPDGSRVASGSFDQTVKLWDVASGKELATLQGHSGQVTCLAFSPDGSRVASGSDDNTVKLWDVASGKELATLLGHSDQVTCLAFNPNGSSVASGSPDSTVKLWDVASGKELATLQGYLDWVSSVAFSPDGSRVAYGSDDKTVRLWDVASGKELAEKPSFALDISSKSSDGKTEAQVENNLIRIIPTHPVTDILQLERKGYLTLQGHEIMGQTNSSLLTTRQFESLAWRQDLLAQIAVAESKAARFVLRLRLCGQGGQWRALLTVWEEARQAGLEQENAVRHEFAVQAVIAARLLATQENPQAPESLWKALFEACRAEDWKATRFSLPLAQAVPALLVIPNVPLALRESLAAQVVADAPVGWLESVAAFADKRRTMKEIESDAKSHLDAFIRSCFTAQPSSLLLLRLAQGTYEAGDAEWLKLVNQLLAHPEATVNDFTNSAYAAAKIPAMAVAKDLLNRLGARFPEDEEAHRLAGWSYINLADHAAALKSFTAAKTALKPEEKPGTDLLAGLSLAQWLTQMRDEAIATYKQLIETGRAAKKPKEWADPKTLTDQNWPEAEAKPLEALRQATLAKYPKLAP